MPAGSAVYLSHIGDPLSSAETVLLAAYAWPFTQAAKKRKKTIAAKLSVRATAVFFHKKNSYITKKDVRVVYPAAVTGDTSAGTMRSYGRYNKGREKYYNWEDYGTDGDRFNELRITSPAPGGSGTFEHDEYIITTGTNIPVTNLLYLDLIDTIHAHFINNSTSFLFGDLTIRKPYALAMVLTAGRVSFLRLRLVRRDATLASFSSAWHDFSFFNLFTTDSLIQGDILQSRADSGIQSITFSITTLLEVLRSIADETAVFPALINAPFEIDVTIAIEEIQDEGHVEPDFLVTETYPEYIFVGLIQDAMLVHHVGFNKDTGVVSIRLKYQTYHTYYSFPRPAFEYILLSSPNRTAEEITAIQKSTDPFPLVDGDVIKVRMVQGYLANVSSGVKSVLMDTSSPVITRYLTSGGPFPTPSDDPIFTPPNSEEFITSLAYVGYDAPVVSGHILYDPASSINLDWPGQPFGRVIVTTGGAISVVEMYQLTTSGTQPTSSSGMYTYWDGTSGGSDRNLWADITTTSYSLFHGYTLTTTQRSYQNYPPSVFNFTYTSSVPETGFIEHSVGYSLLGDTYRSDTEYQGDTFVRKFDFYSDAISVLTRVNWDFTDVGSFTGSNIPVQPDNTEQVLGLRINVNSKVYFELAGAGRFPEMQNGAAQFVREIEHGGNGYAYSGVDAFNPNDATSFVPHCNELRGWISKTGGTIPTAIHLIDEDGIQIGHADPVKSLIQTELSAYMEMIEDLGTVIADNNDRSFTNYMEGGGVYEDYEPAFPYAYTLSAGDRALLDAASDAKTALDIVLQTAMPYNDFLSYELLDRFIESDKTDVYVMVDTSSEEEDA
jgi:hypothetical protein